MRAFLAVAIDSFREATDRKISTVLLLLSAVFGVFYLAVGIVEVPVEELVADCLRQAREEDTVSVARATNTGPMLSACSRARRPPTR